MEGKNEKEFVELNVRVELPKKVNDFLESFAGFVGISVEDMLRNELETVLENFVGGGFFDAWTEKALKKRGIGEELDFRDC